MCIRCTQSRNTLTGERYFTHRLAAPERIGDKVKQKTLLNLGRHFAIEQADWPVLCARIVELPGGQAPPVPMACEPAPEREAQRIVAQLLVRQDEEAQEARLPSISTPLREVRKRWRYNPVF